MMDPGVLNRYEALPSFVPQNLSDLAPLATAATEHYRVQQAHETCIVQLGRVGDIINILPVAKAIHDRTGKMPHMLVQSEFLSVLSGVSYVTPSEWKGSCWTDLVPAIEAAKTMFANVIVAQAAGQHYAVDKVTPAYNMESWHLAGFLPEWNSLPLIFDKRSFLRERCLCEQWLKDGGKRILLCLSGISSPFKHEAKFRKEFNAAWASSAQVLDMGVLRCDNFYDMLGLMDSSDLLVTVDTAPLHLAAASKIPVIAFISNERSAWDGTAPRCNCVLKVNYTDVLDNLPRVHAAVKAALNPPVLRHVYSQYQPKDEATMVRHGLVERTWRAAYTRGAWNPLPVSDTVLPRLCDDGKRKMPYLKDLLDLGAAGLEDSDIVVFSNSDICFSMTLGDRINGKLLGCDACYAYRNCFLRSPGALTDNEIASGALDGGVDLVAFRAGWWRANRQHFPDYVLGAQNWDWCFRVWVDELFPRVDPSLANCIYHVDHAAFDKLPDNISTLPSQKHNLRLAREFFLPRGITVNNEQWIRSLPKQVTHEEPSKPLSKNTQCG